jgi:hypothetical protein
VFVVGFGVARTCVFVVLSARLCVCCRCVNRCCLLVLKAWRVALDQYNFYYSWLLVYEMALAWVLALGHYTFIIYILYIYIYIFTICRSVCDLKTKKNYVYCFIFTELF